MYSSSELFSPTLNPSKLERITRDFFHANEHKKFVGVRHFLERTSLAIAGGHQRSEISEALLLLLVSGLHLDVESNTGVLCRCVAFSEWYSESPNDSWFGAKGSPLDFSVKGYNSYFNFMDSAETFAQQILSQMLVHLDTEEPTRVMIIGPLDTFQKCQNDRRVFRLALVDTPALSFSILLALNKASLIVDPISWPSLVCKLRDWAGQHCNLVIPELTDSLFCERILPNHQSRVRHIRRFTQTRLYSFFEPVSQLGGHSERIHSSLSLRSVSLIHKINRFDPTLLMLGILPNQLRSLAKEHKMEHIEDSLTLLSDALFWEGYEIWRKRKSLVKNSGKILLRKSGKLDRKILNQNRSVDCVGIVQIPSTFARRFRI